MNRKSFKISICILAVAIVALIYLNVKQDSEKTWDVCYEMTNKRIEWTYAGR